MAAEDYRKYKDQKPEDTVHRIESILHETGLSTVCEWIESEYDGCYSNRVTIYPTALGSNGKGTDRMYALASGYAELMERAQNALLYVGTFALEDQYYGGFEVYPDEKLVSLNELIAQKDSFTEFFFQQLGCTLDLEKKVTLKKFLESSASCQESSEDEVKCIPFADPDREQIVYLPGALLKFIHGSNGMAAGNTREEALVQGLAEIFERYANRKIMLEHICPPSIPRSVIMKFPSLYRIICEIEKNPAYRVEIKDCSLGRGLPVAAIIIFNRNTGNFGVKFASHPSFAVALERTLTEAFQGKNLETFTNTDRIGSEALVCHRDNILNCEKTGEGFYPKELLLDQPDYAFDPDLLLEQRNNKEMLKHMLGLLRREGYHPLIHDASYLGFPSYFIVVPGMSEFYRVDWIRYKEGKTLMRIGDSFTHLHTLTDEEADRIIRYMTLKEFSILENQFSWIFLRPFTERIPGERMATTLMKALLLYQRERFGEAGTEMAKVADYFEKHRLEEADFYKCCSYYMLLRAYGNAPGICDALIRKLFPEKTAARVSGILVDEKKAVSRMYPKPLCFDCGHCEMDEKKYCSYRQTIAVVKKLKDAMKKKIPDHEELLEALHKI